MFRFPQLYLIFCCFLFCYLLNLDFAFQLFFITFPLVAVQTVMWSLSTDNLYSLDPEVVHFWNIVRWWMWDDEWEEKEKLMVDWWLTFVPSMSFSVWSSPFEPSTTSCLSPFFYSLCLQSSASSCSRSVSHRGAASKASLTSIKRY